MEQVFDCPEIDDTHAVAARLARALGAGAVVALHGDLGAGKTCFVQGFARALGIHGHVTSPTFTLVNEYAATRPIFHVDLYRLNGSNEAMGLGLEDYMDGPGVTLIEWAERAADLLPPRTIHVDIELETAAGSRRIVIRGDVAL